jgi:serine/threonine-protein kinase
MLTNQAPPEAKERFLHPESLQPIRTLNSSVPAGVERAVLWAMALHPDERPLDATALRRALTTGVLPPLSTPPSLAFAPGTLLANLGQEERALAFAAAFLILLALIGSFL